MCDGKYGFFLLISQYHFIKVARQLNLDYFVVFERRTSKRCIRGKILKNGLIIELVCEIFDAYILMNGEFSCDGETSLEISVDRLFASLFCSTNRFSLIELFF